MSDKTTPITGGCQCGAVRYEISEGPTEVGYCHCRKCQKAYGNLFGIFALFAKDAVRVTQGELKYYRSSAWMKRGFCPDCGTPLLSPDDSGVIGVQVGSLDHPENFAPDSHWGIESQVPWHKIDDDLPRERTEDDPQIAAMTQAHAGEKSGE